MPGVKGGKIDEQKKRYGDKIERVAWDCWPIEHLDCWPQHSHDEVYFYFIIIIIFYIPLVYGWFLVKIVFIQFVC